MSKKKQEGQIAIGKKGVLVKEATLLTPLPVDTYEFKPYNLYLFIAKPQRVIGGAGANPETLMKLKDLLNSNGIRGVFVMCDFDDLKVYSLTPESVK